MQNVDTPLTVLLAIDDSPLSTTTAGLITHVSWPADTRLHLLNLPERSSYAAMMGNGYRGGEGAAVFSPHSTARMRSVQVAKQLKRHNLNVRIETETGQSSDIILSRAAALTPDIIAVGMDETVIPSLLHRSESSLLVARSAKLVRPLSTLVVVDDNAASEATLDLLCRLSLPNWARVTLLSTVKAGQKLAVAGGRTHRYVSTVEPSCHSCRAIGQLEARGVRVWRDRQTDGSVDDILATAQQEESSLIVVGWSQDDTQFIEKIVKNATCSVLVVRE